MFTIKNQIESYIFQQLIIKNYDKFKLFHQIYFTTTLNTSFLKCIVLTCSPNIRKRKSGIAEDIYKTVQSTIFLWETKLMSCPIL